MALEFVIVKYPASRTVYVDSTRAGFTNTIVVVQRGHHAFDLGNPRNYTPPKIEELVANTAVTDPLVLEFEKQT